MKSLVGTGTLMALMTLGRRLGALAGVLLRHGGGAWVVPRIELPGIPGFLARRLVRHVSAEDLDEPQRVRQIIEELGGSFLKLGQMVAIQPDLLPPAYTRELLDLLDRVPAEDFDRVERVVVEELGASPTALFDQFDPEPFASASIGQVHRARLDGVDLAVKIQRPGAEAEFRADLRLFALVSWGIRRLGRRRWRWIADHLDEMGQWVLRELDYRVEAAYGLTFERCFRSSAHQRVPRIVESHSSRRVLSMEFLDAPTAAAVWRADKSSVSDADRETFACRVIDNFLEQVFVHGLFHADLHPANLMILPGSVVGYLDLGIVGELSIFARRRLVDMTVAYARGDLAAMAEALLDLSKDADPATEAEFKQQFLRLGESWFQRRAGLPKLRRSFTEVLLDMLVLSRSTGIWPQPPVLKYVRSLMAIDALVGRLAPDLEIGAYLETACRRLLMGRRRPASRRLVRSARHLGRAGLRTASVLEQLAEGRLVTIQLSA